MNENEILDNPSIEIESEDFTQNDNEEILENISLDNDLEIDSSEEEDPKTIDESFEESINDLEEVSENESELVEEDESIENPEEVFVENEDELNEDDLSNDLEEDILSEENEIEESSEENSIEEDIETTEIIEEADEEIEEESFEIANEEDSLEEEVSACVSEDASFITDDLDNISIEFGIEAKGFILSLKMMEAMIEKGYIFKDMLNDKVFDAVMIFNGNLENTVMTKDIKIKIEDGKIQLIKG